MAHHQKQSGGLAGLGTGTGHPTHAGGIGQQLKDKIPGVGHTTGTGVATGHPAHGGGLGQKIKNKIPGMGHTTGGHGTGLGTGGVGHHNTGTTTSHSSGGVVGKIKEKIPCVGTSTAGGHGVGHRQQKKGMMQKIKEKLPGHHGY